MIKKNRVPPLLVLNWLPMLIGVAGFSDVVVRFLPLATSPSPTSSITSRVSSSTSFPTVSSGSVPAIFWLRLLISISFPSSQDRIPTTFFIFWTVTTTLLWLLALHLRALAPLMPLLECSWGSLRCHHFLFPESTSWPELDGIGGNGALSFLACPGWFRRYWSLLSTFIISPSFRLSLVYNITAGADPGLATIWLQGTPTVVQVLQHPLLSTVHPPRYWFCPSTFYFFLEFICFINNFKIIRIFKFLNIWT